jgi:hypothetical protein
MTSESSLEVTLRKAVKAAGGVYIKLPAILYKGIPDRMILLPVGRIFFIELKAEKGRTSRTQSAFRKILQAMGFYSEIIRGKAEVEAFIKEHVNV